MSDPTNPARRLEAAFSKAYAVGDAGQKAAMVDVWAVAFGLEAAQHSSTRHFEVTDHLRQLLSDLADVEAWLRTTTLRPVRYEGHVNRIRDCLSPTKLTDSWMHAFRGLTPDTISNTLGAYGDSMGDWEERIDQKELDDLLAVVNQLEQDVAAAKDVSPEVKQFVLSQLHSIRTAIRDYPWQGAAAIRHAWARANFEWSARPNPHTAADRTLLQKAGGVLAKMVSIVATTAKLLSGTADASEDIAKLIDNAPILAQKVAIWAKEVPKLTGGKGEQ
jgi:hypothetical protein